MTRGDHHGCRFLDGVAGACRYLLPAAGDPRGDHVGGRHPVPDRADRLGLAGLRLRGREGASGGASCSGSVCSRGPRGRCSWRSSSASSWSGGVAGGPLPASRVLCGLAALFMGAIACLAYMFIDLERNEVERGHKAVHNPLKGQVLAMHLARYGQQVRVPLLISATVALIGGFALLNQGLYETVGRDWYTVADERREPIYVDFLAYALTNLLGIVDVLDLAKSHHLLRGRVRPSGRVAGLHVAGRVQVVLHPGVAATDLCLPAAGETAGGDDHRFLEPARADPRAGAECAARIRRPGHRAAAGVAALVPSLTKEQRDQLPLILATIGPSIIPALVRHLHDPHEHVRAIVAAALGRLHALDTVPCWPQLAQDPSDVVRQSVVEALGNPRSPRPGTRTRTARSGRAAAARKGRSIALVLRVEEACRAGTAPRPGRAGRGDAGVCPGRRLGGGADPGRPGAGPDRVARGGWPRADRLVEGRGRNGPLPGGRGPGPGRRGGGRDGGRAGRAAPRRQCSGQGGGGAGARGAGEGGRPGGPGARPALAGPGGVGAHGGGRGHRPGRAA